MKDKLMETFEDCANREVLKYQAGHSIFCPCCQGVLEWKRAVSIDYTRPSTKELVFTTMFCATCFDGRAGKNVETARQAGSKHFGEELTVKITDGRTL